MNDKLRILIEAGLERELSIAQINKDLELLQSKVNNLKIGVEIDSQRLTQVTDSLDKFGKATQQASKSSPVSKESVVEGQKLYSSLQQVVSEYSKLGKVDVTSTSLNPVTREVEGFSIAVTNAENKVERLKFEIAKVADGADINKMFTPTRLQETDFISKKEKELASVQTRVANLNTEIQRFNRAGKELPVGKGKELDKLQETLKNIDTKDLQKATQEVQKLEQAFQRLDKTATARDGLLKKLDSMKLAGVIDENQINQLQTRVLKAESPEQIQRLAKEYGNLYAQQMKITQVDQRRIPLLKELEQMKQRGLLSDKELLGFENQIANAKTKNAIREVNNVKRTLIEKENAIKKEMTLERQNLERRRRIQLQIQTMMEDPQFRRGRAQLIEYNNQLQRLGLTSKLTANQMKDIEYSVKKLRVEMQAAQIKTSTFFGAFQNAMIKFPIWMGASTAFFGTVRGIRSAIDNLIEIDSQMTTLARVSGGEIDRNHILIEANNLAARLGNEIKGVNEGLIDFARQGFRGEGLVAMTEAATLFSNISEMSVEEASSGLTAIMKGFEILPEEIMTAVDSINEVDKLLSHISVMI